MEISNPLKINAFPELHFATGEQIAMLIPLRQPA